MYNEIRVADKLSTSRHPTAESRTKAVALVRQLGIVSATALVISNMIGTGIFTTTGFLAGDLGSPRLVLGIWVVGALLRWRAPSATPSWASIFRVPAANTCT